MFHKKSFIGRQGSSATKHVASSASNFGCRSKLLVEVCLFLIFLYFFGVPSVSRYLSREVMTVSHRSHPGKVPLPTVTVVAANSSHGGWKQGLQPGEDLMGKVCGQEKDIGACIVGKTHSLAETVHAMLGFTLKESLMAPELWRDDFMVPWYGRTHTLVYPHRKGKDWRTDSIDLHVNTSDGLTRMTFIHDPHYFLFSDNPLALPNNMQMLAPRPGRLYCSIVLREHRKLNTPSSPCMEEHDYSFTTCVKEDLSRTVGCRLPWDCLSDQRRTECTTLEQYQAFAVEYIFLRDASIREIFDRTGCLRPCSYREYVLVSGPVESAFRDYSFFSVELWMLSTDITVLTEIFVYPFTSLMAEFGGTFSLFFGISMRTLWGGVEKMVTVIKNYHPGQSPSLWPSTVTSPVHRIARESWSRNRLMAWSTNDVE